MGSSIRVAAERRPMVARGGAKRNPWSVDGEDHCSPVRGDRTGRPSRGCKHRFWFRIPGVPQSLHPWLPPVAAPRLQRNLRNLDMAIRHLLVASALMAVPVIGRAEAAKPETTLRARAVLRKYCAECHDKENKPRGEISVMDRAGMDRPDRPFLAPGSADASQLMRLVEDG